MNRIHGLREIADDYDGFIFDVWGTLYDGGAAFEHAVAALTGLRALGKRIVILSNSPQRPGTVAARLDRIGIAADLYDGIVTSGGVTHDFLAARSGPMSGLGDKVYETGPIRFPETLPDTGYHSVGTLAEADWVLCAGPEDPMAVLEAFMPMLTEAADRGLTMVCANPDLEVLHQGVRQICAGEIARAYGEMGCPVISVGKPHPDVFERSLTLLGEPTPNRCLMVGDNLSTDILGAVRKEIPSLLLTSGIHEEQLGLRPTPSSLNQLCIQLDTELPSYIDEAICWASE